MGEIPEQVARELYAVPPRRFVQRRDAAVSRARAAGDPRLARAIARLRRPTVAAWLVNLLAHRRPDLVAELTDLAGALQDAQRQLHGGTLRDLTAQRRKVVSALVRTAESLAREADPDARGALPLADVEATLGAALADPQVAAQVRAGRLERPVSYTGFGAPAAGGGPADRPRATAATAPGRERAGERERAREEELARAREEERRQARSAAAAAAAERDRASAARRALTDELADIDRALAELADRRADVAVRLGEAEAAERTARRAAERAERRLAALEADRG
ncbi:MAG TPA: hypothetical protein VKY81_05235 [Natronosporangium sp.]|nr:hypothetical protein [Natronosporangium sp.]